MPHDQHIDIGVRLHLRDWRPPRDAGEAATFLLLHGLASNARTWDGVAAALADAGHRAIAVDQRGHGLSDKPATGYDFDTVTDDLRRLIAALEIERPILAGQSWGGNVVLAFGARFPGVARGLIFVDGGFLELAGRGPWAQVSRELAPPNLVGTPRAQLKTWVAAAHPTWDDAGVEATLANFETLPDGTVRPWLTYDRHLQNLRARYDQRPRALFPRVQEPVLIVAADDGSDWAARKREPVAMAQAGLVQAMVAWLSGPHDLHVDQPETLAGRFLAASQGW